jgi:hypothetical protein
VKSHNSRVSYLRHQGRNIPVITRPVPRSKIEESVDEQTMDGERGPVEVPTRVNSPYADRNCH